ncbi:hypothetical protein [Actinomycetospora aeridis]|uniref:Uncharacterized protein n=1 Tax=Actinomycetospora aeridis TaxID=3129231 RepID=A0ABU8MY50_9PSEU
MWHLHWRADIARVETGRTDIRPEPRTGKSSTAKAGSFQRVRPDTRAANLAADVPESVRVRGR